MLGGVILRRFGLSYMACLLVVCWSCGLFVAMSVATGTAQAAGSDSASASAAPAEDDAQGIDFSGIDADYELGHFEEALWALHALQKTYPHHGELLYRLGLVQEGLLDFEAARNAYQQAVSRLAKPAEAYAHLGELLYKMNQYPRAIAAFEHAMGLEASGRVSYMLGLSYLNIGEFAAAVDAFKRAGELDSTLQQKALYGQATSLIRMGENEQGQRLYRQSIAMDPLSDTAVQAKKGLAGAVKLANQSYLNFFGLYGFQFDSNVIQNPSSSASVPVISNTSDFAHTFLLSAIYAPPAGAEGSGYKASLRLYENLHAKLHTFDVTGMGGTFTPYMALGNKAVLSMDMSYDYYLFNYKRYMDVIRLKPVLTYSSDDTKLILSLTASRDNYFQPVALPANNQDGWSVKGALRLYAYTHDHKSSVYLGAHDMVFSGRGNDWGYAGLGANAGADVAVPGAGKLMAGLHGSIERLDYKNVASGFSQKRSDTIYRGDVSLSYPLRYVNVGLMGSYTHEVSTIAVYRYVRMMTGINISGSF